jgi:hypothetical protein
VARKADPGSVFGAISRLQIFLSMANLKWSN